MRGIGVGGSCPAVAPPAARMSRQQGGTPRLRQPYCPPRAHNKPLVLPCRSPECKHGDLDQQLNGDGRWKIEWFPVHCPVGNSNLRYGFQGGNPW